MSGDVLSCYSSGRVTSVSWVEARETIMHPVIHTTAPTTRNNLTLTVRAAAAKKCYLSGILQAEILEWVAMSSSRKGT